MAVTVMNFPKLLRLLAVFTCLVIGSFSQAKAADIAIVGDEILFSGEIKAGDLSDLTKQVFKELSVKPRQLTLSLNSNGNNFEEGILLSLFVQQNGLRTLVKNGNRCNSACALVFLGGTSNDGGEAGISADRNLEVGAELGFHMPFTAANQQAQSAEADNLNVTEAAVQLTRLFDKLDIPGAIRPLLMQQDAQRSLYDATTVEAVELLEINVEGLSVTPAHITRNMAFNGCLNGYRLALRQLPSSSAPADRLVLDAMQSTKPASRIASAEGDFILVPSNYGGDDMLICRIGAEGECQGFFDRDALSSNTMGAEQREDLNDCQRQSNVSILVAPTTLLRDVDRNLTAMQAAEPALLATKIPDAQSPDATVLNEEEAANENGDVSEADAQPIPDIPDDLPVAPEKLFTVLAVQQRQEVICNAVQSFANVRAGPSGKLFPIVSTLPNQTNVTVIGNTKNPDSNHPWYEISFASGRGFIDSELVQRSCLIALAPVAPAVAEVPPAPTRRNVVVCNPKGGDSVNVRSAPHPKNSQVLRKMFNHEKLTIVGEANNPDSGQLYFLVEGDNLRGYVDNEFVSKTCNVSTQPVQQFTATQYICNSKSSVTNMRYGPNADQFGVLYELQNNTAIEVLGPATNPVSGKPWLEISYGGNRGFVDASNVASSCNVTPVTARYDAVICNRDADFVNLRMGPNKDMFEVVAKVYNNQRLNILDVTNNPVSGHPWLKVNVEGNVGYVDSEKVGPNC